MAIDLSRVMRKKGMNINEAAETLGVSTRTIRRYIKSGKIQAELIVGHFGEEYRILNLPSDLEPIKDEDVEYEKPEDIPAQPPAQAQPVYDPGQAIMQSMSLVRELQEKNMNMAAQLGIATERIRNLETQLKQMKLLTAPKVPWWKKPFITSKKKK
jgi:MerR family transcriptional regulator, copper efflux regulator